MLHETCQMCELPDLNKSINAIYTYLLYNCVNNPSVHLLDQWWSETLIFFFFSNNIPAASFALKLKPSLPLDFVFSSKILLISCSKNDSDICMKYVCVCVCEYCSYYEINPLIISIWYLFFDSIYSFIYPVPYEYWSHAIDACLQKCHINK